MDEGKKACRYCGGSGIVLCDVLPDTLVAWQGFYQRGQGSTGKMQRLQLCPCVWSRLRPPEPEPDRTLTDWDTETEVTPPDSDAAPRLAAAGERRCVVCALLNRAKAVATHVASSGDGIMWFECDAHTAGDHPMYKRTDREPIDVWRNRLGGRP